jgi:hypothetical protein
LKNNDVETGPLQGSPALTTAFSSRRSQGPEVREDRTMKPSKFTEEPIVAILR